MHLFLGIDMGTTYFKAGLFDATGRLCGLGRQLLQKNISVADHCELPVTVFWRTLQDCIAQAMQHAGANRQQIRSVSYSSQANSFILLDKDHQPLTPLVLWPDQRVKAINSGLETFARSTGWQERTGFGVGLSPQLCINKLWWFQQQQPALWKRVRSVLTISDYLTFGLTGQKLGDGSSASLLGLMDVQECNWWEQALEVSALDTSCLSTLHRSGTPVGTLIHEGANRIGLDQHTHFCLGGLDHHMAAIGAGVHQQQLISESTGTVLAAVEYTDQYRPQEQVAVAPGLDDHHFFRMSFDANGAGFLEWYQQTYAGQQSIPELLDMAARVQPGSEGLVAKPPATNHQEYHFEGVQSFHHHGHFVRAILESTARSLRHIVQRFGNDQDERSIVSTGGGARSKLWVQIKADVLGRNFTVPDCNEAACSGAALLAATYCPSL